MSLIQWNDYFATGIEILDEQHRSLIDLVNAAAPVLALDGDFRHAEAEALLDELVRNAAFHFATEDRLMREYAIDPRHTGTHGEKHGRLAEDVARMYRAAGDGKRPGGGDLLNFLTNWLIHHILGEDQALVRQIRAIEGGMTPAEAFERDGGDCEPAPAALTQALIDVYTRLIEKNRDLDDSNRRLERLVDERTDHLARALDAAEAANRARNSFIANMSHEIRTPMNAIVGLTWALREHTDDALQLARIEKIDKATRQLQALTDDLLDIARLESGRLLLEPIDFEPEQMLGEVVAGIAEAANAKGLRLAVEAPGLPPLLRGDPVRLRQILANFASNALKFTERGGIVVRAGRLPAAGDELHLRFEVEDSGCGIATDAIPGLFAPFAQADTSTTRRHGGSGLGLAISRRLAEMMGGRVGVDSAPGRGSRFWLELPFAEATTKAGEPRGSERRPPPATTGDEAVIGLSLPQRQMLEQIAALVADDDVQGVRLWHECAPALASLPPQLHAAFAAALAAYDFATAHAMLRKLLDDAGEATTAMLPH